MWSEEREVSPPVLIDVVVDIINDDGLDEALDEALDDDIDDDGLDDPLWRREWRPLPEMTATETEAEAFRCSSRAEESFRRPDLRISRPPSIDAEGR